MWPVGRPEVWAGICETDEARAGCEMELGDEVRTSVSLSGVPAGRIGKVKEIGRLFVVVEFDDGRLGYYAPGQLDLVVRSDAGGERAPLGLAGERMLYGSHLCLLPSSKKDLIESMARYTAAGLGEKEKCVCIFPADWMLQVREAMNEVWVDLDEHVASGRVTLITPSEMYLDPDDFTAEKQLARGEKLLASVVSGGTRRGRAFGYPRPELLDVPEWWEYELRATPMVKATGMLALCGYEPDGWRTDQWARAEAAHPYVVKGGELLTGGAESV